MRHPSSVRHAHARPPHGAALSLPCIHHHPDHFLQGLTPSVRIYRVSDLQCVGELTPPVSLGFSALAFSADGLRLAVCTDEPDLTLHVYLWQQVGGRREERSRMSDRDA